MNRSRKMACGAATAGFGALMAALILCISATNTRAQGVEQEFRIPPGRIAEDLNADGRVDHLDSEMWVRSLASHDAIADVNGDGVIDQDDHDQVLSAIRAGKRERLMLPPVPGHLPEDLVRVEGVRLFFFREEATGSVGYLAAPIRGRLDHPLAEYTLNTPTGASVIVSTSELGAINQVCYSDENGSREVGPIGVDLMAIEIAMAESELVRKLPPIGDCPGCVPLNPPADCDEPEYLYSKWGFHENCLLDFFGCKTSTGGTVRIGVACCFEHTQGNVPDCDDYLATP